MCNSVAVEAGIAKTCIREFPAKHAEHFSSDGLEWTDLSFPISTTPTTEGESS